MKIVINIFLFLLISFVGVKAQTYKGVILDQDGSPIMNAHIKVLNSDNFSISDLDGNFSIEAKATDRVEVSHISFMPQILTSNQLGLINLKSKEVNLGEIVVKSHSLDDITHSVVVTDKIKKGSQPRNLADLFNDIPGFSMQKRSSMASEPSFRAFKYEEMNIKYDGCSKIVHACPNRMDPVTAHVIPEEVRKIEIVKGPYTVRFGQRFGATVNLVTSDYKPKKKGFSGSIEGGYETNGNNIVSSGKLQYASTLFDVSLGGEYRDFGNYTDGQGDIVSSSFNTQSFALNLGVNPTKKQRVQFGFRQKIGRDIMHAGLPMDSPIDDSFLMNFDYKLTNPTDKINSFLVKAYYSEVEHLMSNALRPNFKSVYARTPVNSGTSGGKIELGLAPSSQFLLFVGVDADRINRNGQKLVTVKRNKDGVLLDPQIEKEFEVWQDAETADYGTYMEGNYQLSEFLTANVGVRADFTSASISSPDPGFIVLYGDEIEDISEITMGTNASLKYLKDDFQMQLAYGRGTRSASMIERYIYRFSIGSDSREYIGNPYLKPEINNQIEISVSKHIGNVSFGGGVFYSKMKDYITAKINEEFTLGGGNQKAPKQFWNVDANQYGFDGFLKYDIIDNLQFTSDIAYTKAQNLSFDEPLAQIGPLNGHVGLKWEKKKYWIDYRMRLTAKQDRFSVLFNESETAGYTLIDIRTGFKPIKNLTIGLSALNILDKAYYSHLNFSYINSNENSGKIYETGRSFSIYAKYKF